MMRRCSGCGRGVMRFLTITVLLVFCLALPSDSGSEEEYEFITIRKKASRMRVAVPRFGTLSEFPAADSSPYEMTELTRELLEMTGLFELVPPDAYPDPVLPADADNLGAWKLINTEFLIRGDIARLGGKRYQVELRCFDVTKNEMELGKRYTGEKNLFNRMVMRFIDELIGSLTGRKSALDARVAYISDVSGREEVHVMDTDGSHDQALTKNRTLNLGPAWSPDGKYILYLGYRARNPDLYIKNLAKGNETRFYGKQGLNLPGKFSPDGRMIAFSKEAPDGNMDVYVISVSGRNLKRMTSANSIEISPSWSPDGKLLAFVSDRTGSPQIYIIDLARGSESARNPALRLSLEGGYNSSPAWSPDGRYIAYTGRVGEQFDLFLINMSGGTRQTRRLTATPANEENPSWAPDSRFLVYDSNKYGNYDIYIMSIYGGTPRKITKKAANERMPAWSPRIKD